MAYPSARTLAAAGPGPGRGALRPLAAAGHGGAGHGRAPCRHPGDGRNNPAIGTTDRPDGGPGRPLPLQATRLPMNTRNVLVRSGLRLSLVAAGLATLLLLATPGCSSQAATDAAMPPPEVGVATVEPTPVRAWDGFTGRVAAVETVELRPRVSGYVQRVAFEEGSEVAEGDLLFVIDPRPYRAALAQAEAALERARAEARLARTQHERAGALVEARAISREEFETRRAASAQAAAGVRAAEAAVAAARLDLQFTEVRSPIAGRAGRALVTEGNLAQADATLLTTVVSQDPVHVYFEADERAFLRYQALTRSGRRDATRNPVRVGL